MSDPVEDLLSWQSRNSNLTVSDVYTTVRRTDAFVVRNLSIGALGIIFNLVAVMFLIFKMKLKVALRITLMGMSLNDLCFNSFMTVFGSPRWAWTSEEVQCLPVMYFTIAPILVSNFITVLLSIHNYVAVAYPFKCNQVMTKARSTLAVVACWLVAYVFLLGALGFSLPKGMLCYILVVLPRLSLAIACGMCITCCSVTIGLNAVITVKIRRSRHIFKNTSAAHQPKIGKANVSKWDRASLKETKFLEQDKTATHNNKCHLTSLCFQLRRRCKKYVKKSLGKFNSKGSSDKINNEEKQHSFNIETTEEIVSLQSDQSFPCRNIMLLKGRSNLLQIKDSACITRVTSIDKVSNTNGSSTVDRASPPLCSGEPSNMAIGSNIQQRRTPVRRAKTSVTVLMLTCWSCLLSLPFIVFMVYVAFLAKDRQSFPVSDAGFVISTVCTIHAVGNPVLYAWRFINWKAVQLRMTSLKSLS